MFAFVPEPPFTFAEVPMFRCQDETIDADHDRIILAFSEAASRVDGRGRPDRCGPELLAELDAYLTDHFDREERLMAHTGYAGLEAHARAHRLLRGSFDPIRRDWGFQGFDQLLARIRSTFLGHIVTWDEALAEWIESGPERQRPPGDRPGDPDDADSAKGGAGSSSPPPLPVSGMRVQEPSPEAGRHPVADLLFHGCHPFPPEVEGLVMEILRLNPRVWRELDHVAESWTRLPASGDSCRRVLVYLRRMARDLQERQRVPP